MTTIDARNGMSRATVLALLLGADLAPDAPLLLDAQELDRLLAWSGKRPPGPLDLSAAPLDQAHRDALAGRRDRLDASLRNWRQEGDWVIGRDDPSYPRRLRRRLGPASPPLLFGRGDPALLGRGGVAMVDGRAAADAARTGHRTFAATLCDALAASMLNLIRRPSGGNAITIVRDATPAATAELRLGPPGALRVDEAALDLCCHGLADTVVVSSLDRADAAWNGIVALIALDRQPVWVRETTGDAALLIRMGARPIPPDLLADGAGALLLPLPSPQARRLGRGAGPGAAIGIGGPSTVPTAGPVLVRGFAETQSGFGEAAGHGDAAMTGATTGAATGAERGGRMPHLRLVTTEARRPDRPDDRLDAAVPSGPAGHTLFALFEERVGTLLAHGPLGAGRIAEAMDLTRQQTDAWLLRAETDGTVRLDPQTRLYRCPSP